MNDNHITLRIVINELPDYTNYNSLAIYLFFEIQRAPESKLFYPEWYRCYFLWIHKQICVKVPLLSYFVSPKYPSDRAALPGISGNIDIFLWNGKKPGGLKVLA